MANYYLRNLHAQFYTDKKGHYIKVYFETHMDNSWELIDVQVPPPGSLVHSDLILKFNTEESNNSGTFGTNDWTFEWPVDFSGQNPETFRHVTTVYIFHSKGSDKDSMETVGDPFL